MSQEDSGQVVVWKIVKPFVALVELNRPRQLNAMSDLMFKELGRVMRQLGQDPDVRVIILSGGQSRHFSAGLDLSDTTLMTLLTNTHHDTESKEPTDDIARRSLNIHSLIRTWQSSLSALEPPICPKPIISLIHSGCIGAGMDLITCCDIRFCTTDAFFSIKEVELGLCADLGTLQRLGRVVGCESAVREWCFTGRRVLAPEALSTGLVSRLFETRDEMQKAGMDLAERIAARSPVAVQGTKVHLVKARDESVQSGLERVAIWNMCMLQSRDVQDSFRGAFSKSPIKYAKL